MKIPYQLDPGGRGIRVPADTVDELRLDLTASGLPQSGRVGFEIFDRTAFGATEFLEQVNYRRALEGEIARTIGTISEVASARVHIAMGKDSLFGESRPAKASVVLKLRGQRTLADLHDRRHQQPRRRQRRRAASRSGRHPRQLRPAAAAAGRR